MEGGEEARPIRRGTVILLPDLARRLAGPQRRERDGQAVAETANTAHRAEIMIEAAIFLHQDDDMLDIADGPGPPVGCDRGGAGDGGGQSGGTGQCSPGGEKGAAGECDHRPAMAEIVDVLVTAPSSPGRGGGRARP